MKCYVLNCPNEATERHHLIPRSQDGPDEEWNLFDCCSRCHDLFTRNKLSELKVLEDLKGESFYRWEQAYQWHLAREGLHKLKQENLCNRKD